MVSFHWARPVRYALGLPDQVIDGGTDLDFTEIALQGNKGVAGIEASALGGIAGANIYTRFPRAQDICRN